MNSYCRRHRRREGRPVAVCTGASNHGHSYEDYSFQPFYSSFQTQYNMPQDPPPPYESVDSFGERPQYDGLCRQQHQSRSNLQLPAPHTLRKKRSAFDVVRSRVNHPKVQQQRRPNASTTTLSAPPLPPRFNECAVTRTMIQAAACCDTIAERFHDVLCRADTVENNANTLEGLTRDLSLDDSHYLPTPAVQERSAAQRKADEQSKSNIINVQKAWMYSNSRLPPYLLPYKVYMPSWPVFCRAAEASLAVYKRPRRGEREEYVSANWRQGTKAMVLKSACADHENLIVIAIRGSQWNVMDWAVNFTVEPTAPTGFLDDEGNACHEGFLQVARSMIRPVAARLQQLVEQDPSRVGSTLLFTGHSAGGAVANLLYMHMHCKTIDSALTAFNGVFKRVHCVTFGVPPISLLPLQNPSGRSYEKNMFISFVNEGDPIIRADFRYLRSLVRMYATPAPARPQVVGGNGLRQKASRQALKGRASHQAINATAPIWPVPDATLSNAGRLALLRETPGRPGNVEAVCVSDGQLRDVLFGDPVMHHMEVYHGRIRDLAIRSVTGTDKG